MKPYTSDQELWLCVFILNDYQFWGFEKLYNWVWGKDNTRTESKTYFHIISIDVEQDNNITIFQPSECLQSIVYSFKLSAFENDCLKRFEMSLIGLCLLWKEFWHLLTPKCSVIRLK